MMFAAKNPIADWLWKDLYVWPHGRLSRGAYLGALGRILIVYVIFTQVLAVFAPIMTATAGIDLSGDPFRRVIYGQIGALLLIAFPAWSVFQRRANDFRPDHRERLASWVIGFPLIFAGLICVIIARAFGFSTFLDGIDLGDVRFAFAMMLVGAAFVPGGVTVPEPVLQRSREQDTTRALSGERKPAQAFTPASNPAIVSSQPSVIKRSYQLPEQGRVKPGWFS